LSPAEIRHVSSVELVKAHSPRQQARKPKPSKAPASARRPGKAAPKVVASKAPSKPVKSAPLKARVKPAAVKPVVEKPAATRPLPTKPAAANAKPVAAKPSAAPVVKSAPPLVKSTAPQVAGKSAAPKAESVAKSVAGVTPTAKALAKPTSAPPLTAPSTLPPPTQKRRKSIKEAAGVSTDAVMRRTGKSWDDWFDVLDSAGAQTLDQRGVIAILAQKHGIGPWWQQMIAVGYESLRGKNDKPPAPDGFQINSSCTLNAPVTRVFRLWNDAGERARWLADDRFVVRGATADKVIRARWGKGTSHVAVSFSEKSGRTEVSVEHHQIESSAAAEQMKAYWAKKLGLLDQALAPRR
jgi:hypothetical protein